MRLSACSSDQSDWDWEALRRLCLQVASRYVGTSTEAEDIAQEALIRAWRHRGRLRHDQRLAPWLATIARNEALRHGSRAHPEVIAEIDAGQAIEDELSQVVDRVDLESQMSALADEERFLLHLRYVDDLTQPAIANLLEIPEGTVKVRLHRARAKLRGALQQ